MLSYIYGTYTSSLQTHRTVPTRAAWQCNHCEHSGAQRYTVRRRTRLPVARVAESFWQLAHHLRAHEHVGPKSGVLDRVFEQLQRKGIVKVTIEVASLDSTSVKVHPDGTGAAKKTDHSPSASPEVDGPPKLHMVAADDRTPISVLALSGPGPRWAGGAQTARPAGATAGESASGDGSRIFGRPNTPIGVRYGVHACCSTPEKSRGPLGV